MSINQREFRQALSHFASGVTVVTTRDGDELVGMTVSSFASLSLDPPLVLVCIDHRARTHAAIAREGAFAVTILTDQQEDVALRFASRTGEKFLPGSYRISERGLPVLEDGLVTLECRLANTLPGGDHSIFVGEVVKATVNHGQPLVYYRSQFGEFAAPELLVNDTARQQVVG